MYHKLTIAGVLGRDPEMKYMSDGKAVASFSLAVSDGFGDRKKTIWFKVSVWGKLAETANQFLLKGSKVLVEGKLVTDENGNPRTYTKDGVTKASFEMNASELTFLSSKSEQQETTKAPAQAQRKATVEIVDDDVPF